MPTFSTAHHTLHYVTRGDKEQLPLLLLHGFLGSCLDFEQIMSLLCEWFYCIAVDLPGHGRTRSTLGTYTFAQTSASLIGLLQHLHIQQAHLLGYSMGGRLALYLACQFPEQFLRVVLESASPGLKTALEREERKERDSAIAHQLTTTPLYTFLTQWYQNPLFASLQNHPEAYIAMLQRRKNNSPTELARSLQAMGTGQQPSLWKALEEVKPPMLLIVGALDTKFIAISSEIISLASKRLQVEQKIINNCGHNVHLEAPRAYTEAVASFLA